MFNFHVVTLKEYPERSKRVKELLRDFTYEVHYFNKMSPGWKGCLNSHVSLIRWAKEKKIPFLFVLEDNIELVQSDLQKYKRLEDFILYNKDWDIIYIGGSIVSPFQRCEYFRNQIYRTKGCHGTLSYVISNRFYDCILSKEWKEPIDTVFTKTACQFVYEPFMFYRKHDLNSIVEPRFDYIRQVLFHPIVFQKIEWMFFNGYLHLFSYFVLLVIVLYIFRLFQRREYPVENHLR